MDRIAELEEMSTAELEKLVKAGGPDAALAEGIIGRRVMLCAFAPWAQ